MTQYVFTFNRLRGCKMNTNTTFYAEQRRSISPASRLDEMKNNLYYSLVIYRTRH